MKQIKVVLAVFCVLGLMAAPALAGQTVVSYGGGFEYADYGGL
jgi:hypothetical protein